MATHGQVSPDHQTRGREGEGILRDRAEMGVFDPRMGEAEEDAAQKFGLIANDANCQDLRVRYGDAPHGCRLILREIAQ